MKSRSGWSGAWRVTKVMCGGVLLLAAVLSAACGEGDDDNKPPANTAASPQATAAGGQGASTGNAPKSAEGSIKADPNPVLAGAGAGKTKITWTTKGDLGVVKVYVSENGQPENVFAQGSEGSVEAPWIGTGSTYEFRLYGEQGSNRRLIDKIQVTRNKS
ncbi:MAG: hypothetical protein ABW250_14590 [Pyrinomonadaceae bacterium]